MMFPGTKNKPLFQWCPALHFSGQCTPAGTGAGGWKEVEGGGTQKGGGQTGDGAVRKAVLGLVRVVSVAAVQANILIPILAFIVQHESLQICTAGQHKGLNVKKCTLMEVH